MNGLIAPGIALVIDLLSLALGGYFLLLCLLLALEAIAFLRSQPPFPACAVIQEPVTAVVIIPAHNEELGIQSTLNPLLAMPGFAQTGLAFTQQCQIKLLVVADNCTDNTAAIVRSLGVTAIERHNQHQRGKGYAMDFGLQHLAIDPPDVVVFLDADCQISPAGVSRLIEVAMLTQRPVQANYRMALPAQPRLKHRISAFAFAFKNIVRMRGLLRLGGAIVLGGSGMAFPWHTLQPISLASGAIVEDMQLGIDLAVAGTPALLEPQVLVTSLLPQQSQAVNQQRTRWEHGHLQSIGLYVPYLLRQGWLQRRRDLWLMAWDLCVPPLSLLVTGWVVALSITGLLLGLGSSSIGFWLMLGSGSLLAIAIGIGWSSVGRADLPLWDLFRIPLYVLGKLPLYLRFLVKPQQAWERTDRDPIDLT